MAEYDFEGDQPKTGTFELSNDDQYIRGTVRGKHEFVLDEPEFLPFGAGNDDHPSPVDHMFAALLACQISVLRGCLEKARVDEYTITVDGEVDDRRKDEIPDEMSAETEKRLSHISIELTLEVPPQHESRAKRCLEVYDQGCIVGQSLRAGVDYTPVTELQVNE